MKKLVFTLLFGLIIINTVQSQSPETVDKLFDHNWNRTVSAHSTTYTFIFKSDTTCTFINPTNESSIIVKIHLDGNIITFPAEGCSVEGSYKFTIVENTLTFHSQNDACSGRKDVIEGVWTATDKSSGSAALSSSPKKIYMDIAHGQKFWDDPATMAQSGNVERVKYMTAQMLTTASSLNAELKYLKSEITSENLFDCDLLFIHIPSKKYSPGEIEAITNYLNKGGSLFLVMEVDYWSTLDDANVNDIIKPFDVQFGGQTPDSLSGGYTKADLITSQPLKISYHAGRSINGGTPFCFNSQSEEYPFGTFKNLDSGGKIIVMGDGMVSLYMTSWQGVNDYRCSEFMHDSFKWLLTKE
ncbi:MAG: hypothetical protein ACM34O_03445 [Ignavibacteria bacterium]